MPDADEVGPRLPYFAPTDGSEARETGRVPMDAEPRERSRGTDGVGGDALSHSVRFVERACAVKLWPSREPRRPNL